MKKLFLLSITFLCLFAISCSDDDAALPDNIVSLSTSELGFDSDTTKSFSVTLDRATSTDTKIVFSVNESGVSYGTQYSTNPAAYNGEISLTIAAGATSGTIKVSKKSTALFDGDEYVKFSVKSISDETLVLDSSSTLTLSFGAIISNGSELTLNGGEGGSSAINSVFVDFSNNEQTSAARKSWNLGFNCGSDFAVILNNTTSSTAMEVSIDISAAVNRTDSATYAKSLALTSSESGWKLVDDFSGDLTKTVIKEGKVYLVNLGESQTPIYKIKVTKKDDNTYTLQYSKIDETTVKSIEIAKNNKYSFVYVSLTTGALVSVAPEKTKWDIVWGKSLYQTTSSGVVVPYSFSDLVMINSASGTTAVEVLTSTKSYESLSLSDVSALTFSSSKDVIGSKWRKTSGTAPLGVYSDRFYVVKDASGNYYKLQFLKMGLNNDGGTRGYPQIKYQLLK